MTRSLFSVNIPGSIIDDHQWFTFCQIQHHLPSHHPAEGLKSLQVQLCINPLIAQKLSTTYHHPMSVKILNFCIHPPESWVQERDCTSPHSRSQNLMTKYSGYLFSILMSWNGTSRGKYIALAILCSLARTFCVYRSGLVFGKYTQPVWDGSRWTLGTWSSSGDKKLAIFLWKDNFDKDFFKRIILIKICDF